MAGVLKKTTGLTGLNVARDPHKSLVVLYTKLLEVLKRMPEDAMYRKSTEALTQTRLASVNSEPNVSNLEKKIGGGQVEELIGQAEKELTLARKMLTWQPWQPLSQPAPPNQWKWPI